MTPKDYLSLLEEVAKADYKYGCLITFGVLEKSEIFEKANRSPLTIISF